MPQHQTDPSTVIQQKTLCAEIQACGVGLHTGKQVNLTLRPAPVNTGIRFRRVDLNPVVDIPAHFSHVSCTAWGTTLKKGGATVATAEHVMSAFAGLGVDNAYVDLDGVEVPIMDGSALPFVFLIQSTGLCEQKAPKQFLRILKRVEVRDRDKWAVVEPLDGTRLTIEIIYDHPHTGFSIRNRRLDFQFSSTAFVKEISRARTFGFLSDVDELQKNNLALGGSLENAIVLDDNGIMNQEALRFSNEFVRHKLLDALGDLYLLGHHFVGAFFGYKSGHDLNNQLLLALMQDDRAWEMVQYTASTLPITF